MMINEIESALIELKNAKPLVLSLTNFVTVDFMANALLAVGATPIMCVCDEELEDLVKVSNCIHINIGTLDKLFIERCHQAVQLAKYYQKPIVFDPVGSGASHIRTKTARDLVPFSDIVKANASEIISLREIISNARGVESVNSVIEAKENARQLANQYKNTIVVSGPVDFITMGNREMEVKFGSPLMSSVTGMGCTLTAVIAAFRGVLNDSFASARIATSYFGLCGQLAENQAKMTGTFRTIFIDTLNTADFSKLRECYVE